MFSGPNRSTARVTLSPQQQQILDLQQQAAILLGNRALDQAGGLAAGGPFNLDLPEITATAPEIRAAQEEAERAAFERSMNLLRPEFERQESRLLDRLANQGLPQSSQAFQGEFGTFRRGVNEATENAALQAVLTGEDVRRGQFRDVLAGRQAATQEALTERQVPLNEILTLLGLGQVQQPQFFAPGEVDVLGSHQLAQQAGQFRSRQRSDLINNLIGAAGMIGGAAVGGPAGAGAAGMMLSAGGR